jgi:hypothetical protein
MSSRKKKGTRTNKGGKNEINIQPKTIDDYLKDNIFPIQSKEYITIKLETCKEDTENPKYNYKVSSIKKHTFTKGEPDYSEYSPLTMEALQEGINEFNLKDPNYFIRLMLISGTDGLRIYELKNLMYEKNTNNKEKCGYGTPIYKNKQQAKENEARKLQAQEAKDDLFAFESVVEPEPEDIEQQILSFTLDRLTKINKNENLNYELKLVFDEFNREFESEDIPDNLQKMFEYSLSNDESIQKRNIDLLLNGVQLLIIYKEINKKIELLKEIDDDKRLGFNDIYGLLEATESTLTPIEIEGEHDIFVDMNKIANHNTLKPDQTKYILKIQEYVKNKIDIIIGKLTIPDSRLNKQAGTGLAQDDSVINNRVNPDKNTLLRSNSEPTIPIQTKTTTYTEKQYKNIVNNIIWNINRSNDYDWEGKTRFLENVGTNIDKLLQNPNIKDRKELRDIQFHLSNYLQHRDSTPEKITHYLDRVKTHLTNIYGENTKKHTKKRKQRQNSRNRGTRKGKIQRKK